MLIFLWSSSLNHYFAIWVVVVDLPLFLLVAVKQSCCSFCIEVVVKPYDQCRTCISFRGSLSNMIQQWILWQPSFTINIDETQDSTLNLKHFHFFRRYCTGSAFFSSRNERPSNARLMNIFSSYNTTTGFGLGVFFFVVFLFLVFLFCFF